MSPGGQISYNDFANSLHHHTQGPDNHVGLGVPVMDGYNQELISILWALPVMPDGVFSLLFAEMVRHSHEHFSQEEMLMRETGFPGIDDHHDDHQRILDDLDSLLVMIQSGRMKMPREYIRDGMPGWYAIHHATLDSALASFLRTELYLD